METMAVGILAVVGVVACMMGVGLVLERVAHRYPLAGDAGVPAAAACPQPGRREQAGTVEPLEMGPVMEEAGRAAFAMAEALSRLERVEREAFGDMPPAAMAAYARMVREREMAA